MAINIENLKKLFRTGTKKVRVGFYLNQPIVDALNLLSEKTGESASELVAEILDQYLTAAAKEGLIPVPDEGKDATTAKASAS